MKPVGRSLAALAAAISAVFVLVTPPDAAAEHQSGHTPPQGPARVAFADDFPDLVDHEWGFALGGFGGVARRAPLQHVPVIFVHGNNVDAADWYPVRDDFRAAGWTDQALWALSYNGLGGSNGTALTRDNPEARQERDEMGWDGQSRVTANDVNVPDLHRFILAVRDYTGSDRFSLVGHSLGVTVARKTLKVHPELRSDLVAFVAIAGANHGTSFCPPGSEGQVHGCDEIAADTTWLTELNGPDAADETYAPARWMTVYDGSGAADPAYSGPAYAQSPRLEGADNREFPGTYHNDLRVAPDIVAVYREFLEEAERMVGPAARADGSDTDALAGDTGSDSSLPPPPRARPDGGGTVASADEPLPRSGGAVSAVLLAGLAAVAGARGLRSVRLRRTS